MQFIRRNGGTLADRSNFHYRTGRARTARFEFALKCAADYNAAPRVIGALICITDVLLIHRDQSVS